MARLYEKIRNAVGSDRFIISWHADERCEERGVSSWQLVAGFEDSTLVRERPRSRPNPSIVVTTQLLDGSEVEAIWAWLEESQRALLVTVFFWK